MIRETLPSWPLDVLKVLKQLGGKATTSQIAQEVKLTTKNHRDTKDWASSVRNVLNDYCKTKVDYKRIKTRKPEHQSLFVDLGFVGREKLWGLEKKYK